MRGLACSAACRLRSRMRRDFMARVPVVWGRRFNRILAAGLEVARQLVAPVGAFGEAFQPSRRDAEGCDLQTHAAWSRIAEELAVSLPDTEA